MADELFDVLFEYRPDGRKSDQNAVDVCASKLAQLLKSDVASVTPLFNGQRWIIKRNAPLAMAEKLQQAFERAGGDCLLVPVNDTSSFPVKSQKSPIKHEQSFSNLPDFQYSPYDFSPMLLSNPTSSALYDGKQKVRCFIGPRSPVVGLIIPFIFAVVVALTIQHFATQILSEYNSSSSTHWKLAALSMALFFGSIYLTFSLFTAKSAIDFRLEKTVGKLFLTLKKQHWYFMPTVRYRLFEQGERTVVGTIDHQLMRKKCVLLDQHGKQRISVAPYVSIDNLTLDAAFNLREGVLESGFFDLFSAWFRRGEATPRYRLYIIRDAQGEIIGKYTYSETVAKLYFDPSIASTLSENEQYHIMAMMLLLGPH